MTISSLSRRLSAVLFFLLLTASTSSAQTTYTWTGGDTDDFWFSALNWSEVGPASPPPLSNLTNTFVVLAGSIRTTNELDYSFSANSLTFATGSGAFNVSTTTNETLTLGIGGLSIASGNTNNQTFNANLALGSAQSWAHNGSGTFTVGGAINNGGFLLTVDGPGISSFGGVISGTGGLTKTGAGTLTLGGANSFSGSVAVTGGTLTVAADTAFGAVPGPATPGKIVLNGGILNVTAGFALSTTRGVALGPTAGAGNGTINVPAGQTLSYAGVLANNGGTGGLVKSGTGTLTLSGTNTFTGPVTITGGVLSIGSMNQITPASTAQVIIDGGTLRHTGSAAVTFINVNHPIVIGSVGGSTSGTIDIPNAAAILSYSAGSITPAVAGTGTVAKTGAGTLRVTGVNNTVQKLVVTGGLWQSNTDAGFGAVPGSFLADAITLDGGGISVNSGINLSANRGITLGAGGGTFNASSSFLSVGVISGNGGLTKTGLNTLTLNTAATYSGGTTITAGTIQLSAANNRLPTTGNVAFTAAGTMDLNQRSQTINALSSTGAVGTITNSVASTSSFLTVGNGNGSGTFGGLIQNGAGTVAVTKTGSGTQTLTGVNTYTGATTITEGTLAIGTGGSLAAGSTVAVNSTGMLAGNGTVLGTVNVNAGGAIRGGMPGGTNTLTVVNNVTLNSSASGLEGILRFEANRTGIGTADASRIVLTEAGIASILNLNPGSGNKFTIDLVNVTSPLLPGESYSLTLATVASAGNIRLNGVALNPNDPISNANYSLQSSAFFNFTDVFLAVDTAGTGLVLTFSPVPEPITTLGVAVGVAGLAGLIRRRWSRTCLPA